MIAAPYWVSVISFAQEQYVPDSLKQRQWYSKNEPKD